jgi:hypothetical protein
MTRLPSSAIGWLMVAMCAVAVSQDSQAVTQSRALNANPTSYCQTALPVFDGNVRKRPLAVQNEGGSNAFTCSFATQTDPLEFVAVYVRNNNNAAATISCTGVTSGIGYITPPEYVTKTETVPASGSADLTWSGLDFAGAPAFLPGHGLFNVSCSLAPGVGLNESFVLFHEDVGG